MTTETIAENARMQMPDTRRAAAAVFALVACVVAVAGCAPQPEFSTPIRWSDSTLMYADRVDAIDPRFLLPQHMSIELRSDGTGTVENFPQGTLGLTDDERICLDVNEEGVYSGDITWIPRSNWTFFVRFGDSEMILSDGTARFDGQDWTELRLSPYGIDPAFWRIRLECGEYAPGATKHSDAQECAPREET